MLALAALPAPLLAQAAAPPLRLFGDGFPTGRYAISAPGARGAAEERCLDDALHLLFAGPAPAAACRVTVVADETERAILSWSCPGGDSGRSEIRRLHSELFVVQGRGVRGGEPWSAGREYRRLGPCRRPWDQSNLRSPQGGSRR